MASENDDRSSIEPTEPVKAKGHKRTASKMTPDVVSADKWAAFVARTGGTRSSTAPPPIAEPQGADGTDIGGSFLKNSEIFDFGVHSALLAAGNSDSEVLERIPVLATEQMDKIRVIIKDEHFDAEPFALPDGLDLHNSKAWTDAFRTERFNMINNGYTSTDAPVKSEESYAVAKFLEALKDDRPITTEQSVIASRVIRAALSSDAAQSIETKEGEDFESNLIKRIAVGVNDDMKSEEMAEWLGLVGEPEVNSESDEDGSPDGGEGDDGATSDNDD